MKATGMVADDVEAEPRLGGLHFRQAECTLRPPVVTRQARPG